MSHYCESYFRPEQTDFASIGHEDPVFVGGRTSILQTNVIDLPSHSDKNEAHARRLLAMGLLAIALTGCGGVRAMSTEVPLAPAEAAATRVLNQTAVSTQLTPLGTNEGASTDPGLAACIKVAPTMNAMDDATLSQAIARGNQQASPEEIEIARCYGYMIARITAEAGVQPVQPQPAAGTPGVTQPEATPPPAGNPEGGNVPEATKQMTQYPDRGFFLDKERNPTGHSNCVGSDQVLYYTIKIQEAGEQLNLTIVVGSTNEPVQTVSKSGFDPIIIKAGCKNQPVVLGTIHYYDVIDQATGAPAGYYIKVGGGSQNSPIPGLDFGAPVRGARVVADFLSDLWRRATGPTSTQAATITPAFTSTPTNTPNPTEAEATRLTGVNQTVVTELDSRASAIPAQAPAAPENTPTIDAIVSPVPPSASTEGLPLATPSLPLEDISRAIELVNHHRQDGDQIHNQGYNQVDFYIKCGLNRKDPFTLTFDVVDPQTNTVTYISGQNQQTVTVAAYVDIMVPLCDHNVPVGQIQFTPNGQTLFVGYKDIRDTNLTNVP